MSLFAVSLDDLDNFGSLLDAVRGGAAGAEGLARFEGRSADARTWAGVVLWL